jgi:hypothetical protein
MFRAYAMYVYVLESLLWHRLWLLLSELPRLVSLRVLHCLLFVPCLSYVF